MKTIGQLLKDARIAKKFSFKKLEDITKIKITFLGAIEKEKWNDLPPLPVVMGFVKNISSVLGVDEKMGVALLRRDCPPKKLFINPKPDVERKKIWSPKTTFILGISLVLLTVFGYLLFQYVKFISPPELRVESPKEAQIIIGASAVVFGSTDRDAKITVNNQPVLTDEDGKFSVNIGVTAETKEVVIKAFSRSGKEAVISRKITVRE
jgi:cytoskeletal protein RodZ